MLEVLNIKTGCISEEDTSDDEFDIEAPRAINLLNGSSIQTDLGPYSDNNSPDISIDQFAVSSNKNLPNNISTTGGNTFGGLNETENTSPNPARSSMDKRNLRDKLGTIFNSDSQWFQNFDEQVLKPVFLDNVSPSLQDSATQSPADFSSQNH